MEQVEGSKLEQIISSKREQEWVYKMNPGQLEWTVTDHMAKFSTAEAKAIVHAMLSFFQLELSIWTREVRNSVDSGNSSGMRLLVDVPGVLII